MIVRALRWCVVLSALVLWTPSRVQLAAQEPQVDLALVLAIDCSFSVDSSEFRLQMQGLGDAFRREEVKRAIRNGHTGRIAIAAVQWSDESNQQVIVPWTVIASDADAEALGVILSAMPRKLAEGGTSISRALEFSGNLFRKAPPAERRVIDVSSDGRNNIGPPVSMERDRIVANGITINALAILNEWPTLDKYFENNVVGGQANFVMPADNYESYSEAIFRKLVREIVGPGIS
ncbi:DUF1194 domain-containing protein [soil metagenome]